MIDDGLSGEDFEEYGRALRIVAISPGSRRCLVHAQTVATLARVTNRRQIPMQLNTSAMLPIVLVIVG